MCRKWVVLASLAFVFGIKIPSPALAGTCSPGIPCTGYDIYNQTDAGTSGNYNGSKSGGIWLSPSNSYTRTACDGNFMNQIYARAFMEAQREVMLSEQIIHKPDSVLEYTCFDQFASLAMGRIDQIFTANQEWDDREIAVWTADDDTNYDPDGNGDPESVTINDPNNRVTYFSSGQVDYALFEEDRYDELLEEVLLDSLSDYIDNNFSHTYMGESITLDNSMNLNSMNAITSYDCSGMLAIWEIAKCVDFGEDDRFRSFATLVENDIRSIPLACPQTDPTSGNTNPAATTQIADDSILEGDNDTKLDETSSGEQLSIGVSMPGVNINIPGYTFNTGGLLTRMPSEGLSEDCPDAGGVQTDVNTDISNDLIRIANNCDEDGGGSDPNRNIYSSFDLMETYSHLTKGFGLGIPGAGTDTGAIICTSPIPTGLPVITFIHSDSYDATGLNVVERLEFIHYDHICGNPGCYYQPVKVPYITGAPIPEPDTISVGICAPG